MQAPICNFLLGTKKRNLIELHLERDYLYATQNNNQPIVDTINCIKENLLICNFNLKFHLWINAKSMKELT